MQRGKGEVHALSMHVGTGRVVGWERQYYPLEGCMHLVLWVVGRTCSLHCLLFLFKLNVLPRFRGDSDFTGPSVVGPVVPLCSGREGSGVMVSAWAMRRPREYGLW